LQKEHGLNLLHVGTPLAAIYLISDLGSVAGGWISSRLIQRGFSFNAGRKTAMLIIAGIAYLIALGALQLIVPRLQLADSSY
jgi:ACS family hexuronate transporter-like MFS transporter